MSKYPISDAVVEWVEGRTKGAWVVLVFKIRYHGAYFMVHAKVEPTEDMVLLRDALREGATPKDAAELLRQVQIARAANDVLS